MIMTMGYGYNEETNNYIRDMVNGYVAVVAGKVPLRNAVSHRTKGANEIE